MGVKVQSHNVSLTSYQLTSLWFHVDQPPIPQIQHFQIFTLKIQGQGHSSRSQSRYNTLSTYIPSAPCWSALPFLGYSYCKIPQNSRPRSWVWSKFKVTTWVQHSVHSHPFHSIGHPILKLRLFQNLNYHRIANGINPSSGSRDMGSVKSAQSAAWFDKFWAHGQAHMGQMGK